MSEFCSCDFDSSFSGGLCDVCGLREQGADSVVAVEVACPDCGNANREARRRCRGRGPCGGSGLVTKYVPRAHDA